MNHWLETHQGLRPNTRKCYADHVRLHLIPHLGRIDLGKLSGTWHGCSARSRNAVPVTGNRSPPLPCTASGRLYEPR
ncbi:hypothetical protein [Spongiactinospora rosea]|uniref:hypothetical protein n=1 Tax=Spongiactinospora rosea TaxID=2248750 RepID=UPI001CED551C